MPLPADASQPWPPRPLQGVQRDVEEAAAWYSDDRDRIARFYANNLGAQRPSERARFWARNPTAATPEKGRMHVPAASDVAAVSADLLFGEVPDLSIAEAHEEKAPADAVAAEDRLAALGEHLGLAARLLEAAEVCAGVGGVYLRVAWDETVADHPLLAVVHQDQAVPEFRWGVLVAVTFWRVVHEDAGKYWRHLERHEPGVILHGLYVGDRDRLGVAVSLSSHPDTFDLDPRVLVVWEKGLLVRYVPNMLPNRKRRGSFVGQADTAGAEDLMSALDECYTSWLRDIRVGQARIVVPNEYLNRLGRGHGASFDVDQEVFVGVDIAPSFREGSGSAITPVEFQLRTEDHERTALALFERVIAHGGYSPQSFGLHIEGRAESGTALRIREGRTLRTKARKERYWAPAVEDCAWLLLACDRWVFGRTDTPIEFRPTLTFSDSIVDDPRETAETVNLLAQARSASVETRVRLVSPGLDEAGVKAEVQRIRDEDGLLVADPTGFGGVS